MTDIAAEVVGPVDRPPVPTETPEMWAMGRWHWNEGKWTFWMAGYDHSRAMAEKLSLPGDILIRIPASGGGK